MKKITLLLAGLMVSGAASAVQLTAPSGLVTTTGACATLLNEDVAINLTSNVVAGVACSATRIAISTCHTAGRTASRTAPVTTCTDPLDNTTCTTANVTVTGPAMAGASTARGTVTSAYPAGLCTATTAETAAGLL